MVVVRRPLLQRRCDGVVSAEGVVQFQPIRAFQIASGEQEWVMNVLRLDFGAAVIADALPFFRDYAD